MRSEQGPGVTVQVSQEAVVAAAAEEEEEEALVLFWD
jgi:hypothetical protein